MKNDITAEVLEQGLDRQGETAPDQPGAKAPEPTSEKGVQHHGERGGANPVLADPAPTPHIPVNPVDSLYATLASTFGNSNPMQLFSLVWPGTLLDRDTYLDTAGADKPLPVLAEIAQSTLFDQFYPIAPVTQPDGTRVSDRYRAAIESFGPRPNEALIEIQRMIRHRIDQQATIDINGHQQSVTLLEKFNILQERWIDKQQQWSHLKADKLSFYRDRGDADWWEQYVGWYEGIAASYKAGIDAAYNRMLADFPINEFEDALAILDTHDAAALLRAKQEVRNALVPVPENVGGSFYSTQAVPRNWGNALKSSSTFRDMLAAPEAQQRHLNLCINQLGEQIFSWQAVLAQIPDTDKADIAKALDNMRTASAKFYAKSADLQNIYSENVVVAVKTYMQYQGDKSKQAESEKLVKKLDLSNPGGAAKKPGFDYGAAAEKIAACQKALNDGTQSMVGSGVEVAQMATTYLNTLAGSGLRDMIGPVLAKLQSQLAILQEQIRNFSSAAVRCIELNGDGETPREPADKHDPLCASTVDDKFSERWSEVTLQLKSSDMKQSSQANTSFQQSNWGVNFFFGSAGGQSSSAEQSFESHYMSDESEVLISMLATKVVIERPWMHPELFAMSGNYFKAVKTPVTTAESMTRGKLLAKGAMNGDAPDSAAAGKNCEKLTQAILPGYPVALLLAKDITIKMKLAKGASDALQKHSERTSSSGGGFLCFSVSRSEKTTADSKSLNSYSSAGDFVFRIPAPQVIGVWNQILPEDKSKFLDKADLSRILQFKEIEKLGRSVTKLQNMDEEEQKRPGS